MSRPRVLLAITVYNGATVITSRSIVVTPATGDGWYVANFDLPLQWTRVVATASPTPMDADRFTAQVLDRGEPTTISGSGNGPIAAFVDALRDELDVQIDVVDYSEHSLGAGADATAVSYVETIDADGSTRWGIGTDPNIITASLKAVLSAAARGR